MKKNSIEIQNLTRNCNEDLILAVLHGGDRHGYQLALEIEERSGGFFRFNHGTLYPILHKLEKEGKIRGSWRKEAGSRKRRRYSLTAAGKRYVDEESAAWRRFFDNFFEIMGDVEK